MSRSDTPTPEQLARLPVWGREHIAWLAQRLTENQGRVAELSAGPADSNVLISYFGTYPDRLLGVNVPVRFLLPGGEYIEVRHQDGGVIEVYGSTGALHVTPRSSNVVQVRIGEH